MLVFLLIILVLLLVGGRPIDDGRHADGAAAILVLPTWVINEMNLTTRAAIVDQVSLRDAKMRAVSLG
jgi:hypothetical protein